MVKGLEEAEWVNVDWRDITEDGINAVADMVGHLNLKLYVIDNTGSDEFWMAIAK